MLSTLLEIAGLVALVVAAAMVAPELGVAVAGVALVAVGYFTEAP